MIKCWEDFNQLYVWEFNFVFSFNLDKCVIICIINKRCIIEENVLFMIMFCR